MKILYTFLSVVFLIPGAVFAFKNQIIKDIKNKIEMKIISHNEPEGKWKDIDIFHRFLARVLIKWNIGKDYNYLDLFTTEFTQGLKKDNSKGLITFILFLISIIFAVLAITK